MSIVRTGDELSDIIILESVDSFGLRVLDIKFIYSTEKVVFIFIFADSLHLYVLFTDHRICFNNYSSYVEMFSYQLHKGKFNNY